MALPDFIIIGAMKCGTSTLQAQLAQLDGVFMTTPKEPNFFSDDDVFVQGQDWYENLFAGSQDGNLKGEASTHYTKRPTYPKTLPRMQAILPRLRLIYMIRNPMARAVSHYIHEWTEGRAVSDADVAFHSCSDFVDYGCYGAQIRPFLEAYGKDSIHLTFLEGLKLDPVAEFRRVADFLGLPESAVWDSNLKPQNVSAERMRRIPFQEIMVNHPVARTLRRTLVPKSVRTFIRQKRSMQTRPEIPTDLRESLQERFLRDREELAAFFPGHPALDLCYPFTHS